MRPFLLSLGSGMSQWYDSLIFWDIDHCTFLCFEDGIHGVTHNLKVKGEANTPKESNFMWETSRISVCLNNLCL